MLDLVLLRHGRSQWNDLNLFTGWYDVDLAAAGEDEATAAGVLLNETAGLDLVAVHTSLLTRAIHTAELALNAAGRSWLPVTRDWRLNERHYGDLTGKDKKETAAQFGLDQVTIWRRSFDVPPPPLAEDDPRNIATDPRYRHLDRASIPLTECLKDVVHRVRPYLTGVLAPALRDAAATNGAVLVTAHGNSIRAIRMILESISESEITELEIPTGIPYRVTLDDDLTARDGHYLGDPDAAARAAEAVKRQAG